MEASEREDGPSLEALSSAREVAEAMVAEAVGELEVGREAGGLLRLRLVLGKMIEEWQQAAIEARREADTARSHAERVRYRVHAELLDAVVAMLKSAVTPTAAAPTVPPVDPRQPRLPFIGCTPRPPAVKFAHSGELVIDRATGEEWCSDCSPAVAEDADFSADRDWAAAPRCPIHGVSLSAVHGCALCNPPVPVASIELEYESEDEASARTVLGEMSAFMEGRVSRG